VGNTPHKVDITKAVARATESGHPAPLYLQAVITQYLATLNDESYKIISDMMLGDFVEWYEETYIPSLQNAINVFTGKPLHPAKGEKK
jgi:hypothetical protein